MAGTSVDHAKLEAHLRALAYASRLELLSQLRTPRPMSEIRISPQQVRPGENPERPISRQAIEDHLEKLIEAGVVQRGRSSAGGRSVNEYVVNQPRLYAILEELRRVFSLPGHLVGVTDDTAPLAQLQRAKFPEGPCLALVHGLHEGRTFSLEGGAGTTWTIGRAPDATICLSYDPFVSNENARIHQTGHRFELIDLPGTRNGTLLNWRQLAPGESAPLVAGDIVGVGRSLLVFRGA